MEKHQVQTEFQQKSRQNADLFTVAHFRAKTKTTNILVRELFFADDSALIAHSTEEIQRIVDGVCQCIIKVWPQDQHTKDISDVPTELYNGHGGGY